MKNLLKSFFTLLLLLVTTICLAQNENSLLWKISGNGLTKSSYVFGTIHAICEQDYFMSDKVEQALSNSEVLITEINFGNTEEMMQMQKELQSDVSLKERITKKQYEQLSLLLEQKLGINIDELDKVSESAIASLITIKSFPCENLKMYEIELIQKAMASQKSLDGLESIAEQMKIMENHLNMDVSIKMLEEIGTDLDLNKDMVELYKEQNIDALLDLMNKASYMDSKAYNDFVVIRNNNWVKKMPELMKSKPTFFAVGAAHLGSKDGVLDLLRNAGYKVEAVK